MSTISTTFHPWKIPGHPQVLGKQATTTFTCGGAHLLLRQERFIDSNLEVVHDLNRSLAGRAAWSYR